MKNQISFRTCLFLLIQVGSNDLLCGLAKHGLLSLLMKCFLCFYPISNEVEDGELHLLLVPLSSLAQKLFPFLLMENFELNRNPYHIFTHLTNFQQKLSFDM